MTEHSNYWTALNYARGGHHDRALVYAQLAVVDAMTAPQVVDISGDRQRVHDGESLARHDWRVEFSASAGVWVGDGDVTAYLGADPDALAEAGRFMLDCAAMLAQAEGDVQ